MLKGGICVENGIQNSSLCHTGCEALLACVMPYIKHHLLFCDQLQQPCVSKCCSTILSASIHTFIKARQPLHCCRDVSDRALRVLCNEAKKYSEVRSRLATLEGLQAAALFQQGLKQHSPPTQPPTPAGLGPEGNSVCSQIRLCHGNSKTCLGCCFVLLCCLWQLA